MLRILSVIVVFMITLLALVILFAKDFASFAGEIALKRAGFEDVSVNVTTLTTDRLEMGPIVARHPDATDPLRLARVEVTFDWRSVWRDRRVKSIQIGSGKIIATISDDHEIFIAGMRVPKGDGGGTASVPFGHLEVEGLDVGLVMPGGQVNGQASGEFDLQQGGAFTLDASTQKADIDRIQFGPAQANAKVIFEPNGELQFSSTFTGDIAAEKFQAQSIDIAVNGSGSNWRSILSGNSDAITGQVIIDLADSVIAPVLDVSDLDDSELGLAEQIDELFGKISASGKAVIDYNPSDYSVKLIDRPITLMSEKNDTLTISSMNGRSLFESNQGIPTISSRFDHTGRFKGYAEFDASLDQEKPWAYNLKTAFDRQLIGRTILKDADVNVNGIWDGANLDGSIDGAVTIAAASIGRLRAKNASVNTDIEFTLDLENQTLVVAPDGSGCVRIKNVSLRVLEQGMESDFERARLCAQNGQPLASIDWHDEPLVVGLGVFQADNGRYRLGETTFAGVPPSLSFAMTYRPDVETTSLSGDFAGGVFTINDALMVRRPVGKFSVGLKGDALSGDAEVSKAIIMQPGETALMTPMSMAGAGALDKNKVTFDISIATLAGDAIAIGSGIHDVEYGNGRAEFQMPSLEFVVDGLQPDDIAAALKGVISDASGGVGGEVTFDWDQNEVRSSGAFDLSDVTFLGPGTVVTQTRGVTGGLQLRNLLPLETSGEQTIDIGAVDFGALALTNGTVQFELPGDDTLKIINASFPWFGGVIGAYDTQTPLTGGNAQTLLRAENVNLGDLLAELDIEGLSGEGIIEGILPIAIEDGRARIENGVLSANGPGIIRYQGKTTDAVAAANKQADFAFDVLRELRFSKLSASIDGPLDGNLSFNILMEGQSEIPINDPRVKERVSSPVIYRVNLDAPLLALFDQARLSTDIQLQYQRQQQEAVQ